jgi:hypothetical protein
MARPVQRRTLVALKARQQAMRLAASVRDEAPLDVNTGYCRACGAPLDLRDNVNGVAECGQCGADVRVPPHAMVFVPGSLEPGDARRVSYRVVTGPARNAPDDPYMWLSIIAVLMLVIAIALLFGALMHPV